MEVRLLVELLIVIDAERQASLSDGCSGARNLRREEPRGHGRHHAIAADAVKFRNFDVQSVAGDFRVMPIDRKGDGRVAEHAEVEGVVRVLPDVFAADYDALAESLLEAGMKLIAEARLQAFPRHRKCS